MSTPNQLELTMTVEAGPTRTAGVVLGLGALVLLVVAAVALDGPGRVLAVPLALLLAAAAARDLLLAPTLRASASGLEVVVGASRRAVRWDEVERLRVVTDRRAPLLEVDLGDELVVLSRRRLGRPPAAVLADLESVRP